MRRREFIAGLGSAAAWPVVAQAQQQAVPVIGYLEIGTPLVAADDVAAFREGLGQAGYIDGRNLAIEYRWANLENDRLAELATDLVRRQVAVIVASSGPAAVRAAK